LAYAAPHSLLSGRKICRLARSAFAMLYDAVGGHGIEANRLSRQTARTAKWW
jgi:hypothetical protein